MVVASQNLPTIVGTPPPGTQLGAITGGSATSTDAEALTWQFVAGWILFLAILKFISMNRLGYVAIYYSLLLLILLLIVSEYTQIVPLLNQVQSIGSFNQRSVK